MSRLEILEKLFENYSDAVYISDMDDYTIQYLNAAGRRQFHAKSMQDCRGRKCYEFLHGGSSPCSMCNNAELTAGAFDDWSIENQLVHHTFTLHDTMIEENGHRYRVEVATDTNEQFRQQQILTELSHDERIINDALALALNESDPDRSIEIMLSHLGRELHCERVYIFEQNRKGTFDNTYEWCREGVEPEKELLQDEPWEVVKVWYDEFDRHRNILIRDLEEYKSVSRPMYDVLKPQNIHSLVVGPLMLNGRRIGFYGVDNPPVEAIEHISTMYEVLGHFISALLRHRDNEKLLRTFSYIDPLTELGNRHALERFFRTVDKDQSISYFYCDLNGLKKMNDTQGHSAGDQLLIHASQILIRFFDPSPVFRMGGDEFLALVTGISEEEAKKKEADLKSAFEQEHVSSAVGMVWRPNCEDSVDAALTEADARMYLDKRKHYGERRKSGNNQQTPAGS